MDAELLTMSSGALWLGAVLYALQIYFDFSGYSDMAIGLGKMFGFDFSENFNYPYLSASIKKFWRRWHISLSTWFKEYVYISLGGNRKGKYRTYLNLMIVFFLTGLWHGASYSFIFWGLYHGAFLLLERGFLGRLLKKNPLKCLNHLYACVVVTVGWVFFRHESIRHALAYVRRMFSFAGGDNALSDVLGLKVILLVLLGILCSGALVRLLPGLKQRLYDEHTIHWGEAAILFALLFFSIVLLASDTYNPFIYFRF